VASFGAFSTKPWLLTIACGTQQMHWDTDIQSYRTRCIDTLIVGILKALLEAIHTRRHQDDASVDAALTTCP